MMKKNKLKMIIIYILAVAILFSIPCYMIIDNVSTVLFGKEYLFRIASYDPYDMFRGKYLSMGFADNVASCSDIVKEDDEIILTYYANIGVDNEGFAYFTNASQERIDDGSDYYVVSGYRYGDKVKLYPPDRYYMNELKISNADELFNKNRDKAYVKVKVKDGKMVIVGLYIDGILVDEQ